MLSLEYEGVLQTYRDSVGTDEGILNFISILGNDF